MKESRVVSRINHQEPCRRGGVLSRMSHDVREMILSHTVIGVMMETGLLQDDVMLYFYLPQHLD